MHDYSYAFYDESTKHGPSSSTNKQAHEKKARRSNLHLFLTRWAPWGRAVSMSLSCHRMTANNIGILHEQQILILCKQLAALDALSLTCQSNAILLLLTVWSLICSHQKSRWKCAISQRTCSWCVILHVASWKAALRGRNSFPAKYSYAFLVSNLNPTRSWSIWMHCLRPFPSL